ncbi:MAG: 3-phosphoglycerate dehydrogenase family protein [Anaeromyxobacter sp.]
MPSRPSGSPILAALGVTVDHRPDVSVAELPEAAREATVLIVRGKQVTADVFERASALSLVIRAGAGVNTIDVAAASRRGVYVANCPGQNSIAVAELAIGLLLALDRRIPDNVAQLRAGKWDKKTFSEAAGVFGRTLGVVGTGSIGKEVVRRALALGLRVVAWSRSLTDEEAKRLGVERSPDLLGVARAADFLTLHVALNKETRGLVSREVLAAMKPGAALINTARAEVVDQEALLEAAQAGRLRVATDVFAGEPEKGRADFAPPLAQLANVYGTHHIGASTAQAQDAIARETVRMVAQFLRAGEVASCVNLARKTPAKARLLVRHQDKVGVLAAVLGLVREAGLNVEGMQNVVFDQAQAASASIDLSARPPQELLEQIRGRVAEVLFVDCVDL